MANLSITQAWNETAAFVKREAGLVIPVALLLFALPGAALQLTMPAMEPGVMPDLTMWLLLLPVVMVASIVGSVAITYMALRPGVSVGEALQHGLRRFIFLFLASLLVAFAFAVVAFLLILLFLGTGILSGEPAAAAGPIVLLSLLFVVAGLLVWIRLLMMTPVGTMENAGPIDIIRRSWELTSGHFWKLLGFVLLVLVAGLVILTVVMTIFGIVVMAAAGPAEPGSTSAVVIGIVSALLQSLLTALLVVLVARIYAQLSGGSPEQVFA